MWALLFSTSVDLFGSLVIIITPAHHLKTLKGDISVKKGSEIELGKWVSYLKTDFCSIQSSLDSSSSNIPLAAADILNNREEIRQKLHH